MKWVKLEQPKKFSALLLIYVSEIIFTPNNSNFEASYYALISYDDTAELTGAVNAILGEVQSDNAGRRLSPVIVPVSKECLTAGIVEGLNREDRICMEEG